LCYTNTLTVSSTAYWYIQDISQRFRVDNMESNVIQLELSEKTITIKTEVLRGVLTSKTFRGNDCYSELLRFIKEAFLEGTVITATIILK
jgi:hypothetical protein